MSDSSAYITNIHAFLPNAPVSNEEMERILGQVGGRPSRARRMILRSNGITSRHYAIDPETLEANYTNAQLAAEAIRGVADGRIALDDIQCLASGTSMPDQLMPSHASMVHGELGTPPCEVISTAGVCVSSMAALKYAFMGILSGQFSNAIASGSDVASAMMTAKNFDAEYEAQVAALEGKPEIAFEKDFLRWMLSDGAGAMLLQNAPAADGLSLKIDWLDIFSYAGEMQACMYAGAVKQEDGSLRSWKTYTDAERAEQSVMTVKQDVKLLNDNIIHYTVEKPLLNLQQKYNLRARDIDWFVPHYSSNYFRDRTLEGLKAADFYIPQERWFTNLTRKGNTGAASMYIMLEELFSSGRLQSGQRILCWIPESGRFSGAFLHLTVA